MTSEVTWWIRQYSASTDKLISERQLPEDVTLEFLQRLFGRPHNDPMYDCYPVTELQAAQLRQYVEDLKLQLGTEWFLEAYASE